MVSGSQFHRRGDITVVELRLADISCQNQSASIGQSQDVYTVVDYEERMSQQHYTSLDGARTIYLSVTFTFNIYILTVPQLHAVAETSFVLPRPADFPTRVCSIETVIS